MRCLMRVSLLNLVVMFSWFGAGCGMGEVQPLDDSADLQSQLQWKDLWNPILESERWIWRQVANLYMRPRQLEIAAVFLEHSLQNQPQTRLLSGDVFNSADRDLQYIICQKALKTTEIQQILDRLPNGNTGDGLYGSDEWRGPIRDTQLFGGLGVPEIRSDNDLFTSFQHVEVFYRGWKYGAYYNFEIKLQDTYTFHWQILEATSLQSFLATLGANAAYLDQLLGAIVPYDIEAICDASSY